MAAMASSSVERKNWAKTRRPSSTPAPSGAVALADQDLVEDGQDEREQHEGRRHEVGELAGW